MSSNPSPLVVYGFAKPSGGCSDFLKVSFCLLHSCLSPSYRLELFMHYGRKRRMNEDLV